MKLFLILLLFITSSIAAPAKSSLKNVTMALNSTKNQNGSFDIATEINIGQAIGAGLIGIYNNFYGCVYGKNCGGACSTLGRPSWNDDLDQACYQHDLCLQMRRVAWNAVGSGACHRNLATYTSTIYNKYKKCSWWQWWCTETKKVETAYLMGMLFSALGRIF